MGNLDTMGSQVVESDGERDRGACRMGVGRMEVGRMEVDREEALDRSLALVDAHE